MKQLRKQTTQNRHKRIRKRVSGTSERPRLAVFRSHQHIYAQVIDDVAQHTLVSASTVEPDVKAALESTATQDAATAIGQRVAERAIAAGITKVVFDRGGKLYHGRVKALAEAARAAGLEF